MGGGGGGVGKGAAQSIDAVLSDQGFDHRARGADQSLLARTYSKVCLHVLLSAR